MVQGGLGLSWTPVTAHAWCHDRMIYFSLSRSGIQRWNCDDALFYVQDLHSLSTGAYYESYTLKGYADEKI